DGLSSAFGRLLNGTANHGSYFSIQELSSDEAVITQKGGDWFDGGIWLNMHKHDFRPTNDGVNNAWNDTYGSIAVCNELLAGTVTDAQKAQLRMLRAYFYWRLLDLYGNVKIITSPTVGVNVVQSNRAAVFDFVEAELLAAIPDLPPGKAEYGRASQGAAYALLARLYLNALVYRGSAMYQKAIDAADMVINSGVYNLDPDYKDVFAPDNVENVEHIFVAVFDEATGTGMNFAQMTLHYPSQLTFKLAQQPWNGYSTLEEFYNSYEAADKRKENNFIVGPQTDFNGNPILDLAFDKADPDGAPINYTPAINELAPNGSRQAGARLGKFRFKTGQNPDMDNDFPLLRYGEVLLNKAEAVARLNTNFSHATTLALVNQLRTRAGVATFASMTEGQLLAERGRELFQESLRRTDLIRFGAWGNAWWEKAAHSNANLNLFPIPLSQINAAAGTAFPLTQNPGY
ncbi:MAG: RagB/SusD family nutrient uptake outer membrane protein, partial [Bacteroidota bacterium]